MRARWKPHEFQDLGFEVYGMYPRFTEGSSLDPIYFLSYLLPLMWLVKHFPKRAKAFIGIKRFHPTIPIDALAAHELR